MSNNIIYNGQKLTVSEFRNLKVIKNNELARAISSKLVRDSTGKGIQGYTGKLTPDENTLNRISETTGSNIEEFGYIFQNLPDTKIAMEIWVTCLMSPKDSITESLVWSVDSTKTEYSAELFGLMLDTIRNYFELEYPLIDIVKPAIEDSLFKTGSYPLVVVPESQIDDVINGKEVVSSETFIERYFEKNNGEYGVPGIGFLGDKVSTRKVGIESIIENSTYGGKLYRKIHDGLTITDNPDILKYQSAISKIKHTKAKQSIRSRYGIESYANVDFSQQIDKTNGYLISNKDDREHDDDKEKRINTEIKNNIIQNLYQDRAYDGANIVLLKDGKQNSRLPIGHPLVIKASSSSFIPVHVPGNPRDIIGGFLILDEFGNPIDTDKANDLYDESKKTLSAKRTQAGALMKQMSFFSKGCCDVTGGNDREILNNLAKVYASLLEEDLITRLSQGIYGENIELSKADEIYRIMFSRALVSMRTQILYIPSELVTYFAFDYNKFGVGKSLLEDGKQLATMRSALVYADMEASITNSIGRKRLIINIDEDDPNPSKTVETIRNEYLRVNAFNMPLMSDGPVDSINTLREANIDTVVQGDNPAIPNTQVEIEDVNTNRTKPDDQLKQDIRNMHIQSWGIPPTVLDETANTQFATTAMNAHALFTRRIVNYQKIINKDLLVDHVSKYVINSGSLIKELASIIKDNRELLTPEQRSISNALPIIEEFLSVVNIELPSPDLQKTQEQQEEFDKQNNFIQTVLDNVFPDELIKFAFPNEVNEKGSELRIIWRAMLMQQFIDENGFVPSLSKLLDKENVNDTVSASVKSAFGTFVKSSIDALLELDNLRKLNNEPRVKALGDDDDDGYDSSSSYDESGDGDSYDGDFSADEDFNDADEIGENAEDDPEAALGEDGPVDESLDSIDKDIDALSGLEAGGKKGDDVSF